MKELNDEHKKKFGIFPIIIGMYDVDVAMNNIKKAIKDNTPYNEYRMLSNNDKKELKDGALVF